MSIPQALSPAQSVYSVIEDFLLDGGFSVHLLSALKQKEEAEQHQSGANLNSRSNSDLETSVAGLVNVTPQKGELEVLKQAKAVIALPGSSARAARKRQVDDWLIALLPQHSNLTISGSSSSSSSSMLSDKGSEFKIRFELWTSIITLYSAKGMNVHATVMSFYTTTYLMEHLSTFNDLKTRMARLSSIMASTLQPAAFQPDQQWFDDLEQLLQIPHAQSASASTIYVRPSTSVAPRDSCLADVSILTLQQFMCFVHSCPSVYPSQELLDMLTASVNLNASNMGLDTLVDLSYVLKSWHAKIPDSLQQQMMVVLTSPVTPHCVQVDEGSSSGGCEDFSSCSSMLLSALNPLQQLRLLWLMQRAVGERVTTDMLLPNATAWVALQSCTPTALLYVPAEQLLEMGPLLLGYEAQVDRQNTGSKQTSTQVQLWLLAYTNASASLPLHWTPTSANISKAADVVVTLHTMFQVRHVSPGCAL